MTDRSSGFVTRGFRFALATVALTTVAMSGSALAAASKQPAAIPTSNIETLKMNFQATVGSLRSSRPTGIDIDPINPGVLHHWPTLSDTSSAKVMHNDKP